MLQRRPNDADVQTALKQIEDKASNAATQSSAAGAVGAGADVDTRAVAQKSADDGTEEIDDGRKTMHKIFVDSKLISAGDFDLCWRTVDLTVPPTDVVEPFIQTLHEKGIFLHGKIAQAAGRQVAHGVFCRWNATTWTLT